MTGPYVPTAWGWVFASLLLASTCYRRLRHVRRSDDLDFQPAVTGALAGAVLVSAADWRGLCVGGLVAVAALLSCVRVRP